MPESHPFHYEGFSSPNGTVVPDDVFDLLAPRLSEAELRVLLYIIRRTFGFKKESDSISLKQMVEGIQTRDGRALDHGAGLAKSAAARGVKGLVDKGVITATRNRSAAKGDEPTTYTLRFRADPVFSKETRGVPPKGHGGVLPAYQGGVLQEDTQQTVEQQTVEQQTETPLRSLEGSLSKFRKGPPKSKTGLEPPLEGAEATPFNNGRGGTATDTMALRPLPAGSLAAPIRAPRSKKRAVAYSEERERILAYIQDFAVEFHDQAPLKSSVTRAYHLWEHSGLSLELFTQRLYEARALTKERAAAIGYGVSASPGRARNGTLTKMPYFFALLEDILGLREPSESSGPLAPGNTVESHPGAPQGVRKSLAGKYAHLVKRFGDA